MIALADADIEVGPAPVDIAVQKVEQRIVGGFTRFGDERLRGGADEPVFDSHGGLPNDKIFSIVQESGGLQKRRYSLQIGMMFPY